MPRVNICDFVETELDFFRTACNFTPLELKFFNLRAKSKSMTEICFKLSISKGTADGLSRKVRRKIDKVL